MNIKDFNNGRIAGLEMALRLVKEGGIEALEKEIKFRNQTKINLPLTNAELDKASQAIKELCNDTYMLMAIWTLHNEPFRFGEKRCQRFQTRFEEHTKCLLEGFVNWKDIQETIKEEMKLVLEIRNE